MKVTWKACWVDKHEIELVALGASPEERSTDVRRQLRELGIEDDQLTALYEYSTDRR